MSSVSGFLSKTFEIFSDPTHEDICSWGPGGDTIQVKKIEEFSKKILPMYFKHSNFQSFVRQLNMYDFHKTVQDPGNGEFQHMYFLKNRPDLLHLIKRKAHSRVDHKTKAATAPPTFPAGLDGSGLDVMLQGADFPLGGPDDTSKQVALKGDLEQKLAQLDLQKRRILELESQQSRISEENIVLKHMLDDMRARQDDLTQKMEGVLKLLYHMFVSTGNGKSLPKGSLSGIPESRLLEFCSFLNIGPPQIRRSSLEEVPKSSSYYISGAPVQRSDFSFQSQPSTLSVASASSSQEGRPLEKVFSFDSLANSFSLPSAAEGQQLVHSDSFRQLANEVPPPPHPQEGKALSRVTESIGGAPKRAAEVALDVQNKKPRPEDPASTSAADLAGAPLSRRSSSGIPLARLDSLESTLASLLDFDEDGNVIQVDDVDRTVPAVPVVEGASEKVESK